MLRMGRAGCLFTCVRRCLLRSRSAFGISLRLCVCLKIHVIVIKVRVHRGEGG